MPPRSVTAGIDAIQMWGRVQFGGAVKPIHRDCYFKASQSMTHGRGGTAPRQQLEAALFSACMAADTRVAKIIRFKGPMLEIPVGPIRNELKVVHIIRHPVPLVASRVKMRFEVRQASTSHYYSLTRVSSLAPANTSVTAPCRAVYAALLDSSC